MPTSIRPLQTSDAQIYKTCRLNALRLAPTAFSSSYVTALTQRDEFFCARATFETDNFILGAFDATDLIGIGGGYVESERKRQHVGNGCKLIVYFVIKISSSESQTCEPLFAPGLGLHHHFVTYLAQGFDESQRLIEKHMVLRIGYFIGRKIVWNELTHVVQSPFGKKFAVGAVNHS